MIIYRSNKKDFISDVFIGNIADTLRDAVLTQLSRKTPEAEYVSWTNSLHQVAGVLTDSNIPDDIGVSVEYVIPRTQNRIDVIITGRDEDGENVLIIIELKQWSDSEVTDKDAIVKTFLGGRKVETLHPSYQSWSYVTLLESFNEFVFTGGTKVLSCAFLHNHASGGAIDDPRYNEYLNLSPVFFKDEKSALVNFISSRIASGDTQDILSDVENSRTLPSKALAEYLSSMMRGNREFVLIDEQKHIFEEAKSLARKASSSGEKVVLIVRGGPGTGKTVLSIKLLNDFVRSGLNSRYVSRNSAPREVYKAKLTGSFKKTQLDNLFSGSGSYHATESNAYDVLIVDESHRLNEKSGLFGNLGMNQVSELINASKFSIFMLDEDQRVTLKDIGSEQEIVSWATEHNAEVVTLDLESQFRCDGSSGYLSWLDNTLGIRDTANITLDESFDFRVFDNPNLLREEIFRLNFSGKTSRLVAGYCWKWISKEGSKAWKEMSEHEREKAYDIEYPEFGFRMKWNLTTQGQAWLAHPESFSEVGCIHTCQGLDTDYIGVLVGDDFIVRDGEIVIDPSAHPGQDKALQGWKKLIKESPEEGRLTVESVIKNTYRTLMSRGLKGCFIYSNDFETREYFKSRMTQSLSAEEPDGFLQIKNCDFKFRCAQNWGALTKTGDPDVKYCGECDKNVHYCRSPDELAEAIKNDWCVAVVTEENILADEPIIETVGSIDFEYLIPDK